MDYGYHTQLIVFDISTDHLMHILLQRQESLLLMHRLYTAHVGEFQPLFLYAHFFFTLVRHMQLWNFFFKIYFFTYQRNISVWKKIMWIEKPLISCFSAIEKNRGDIIFWRNTIPCCMHLWRPFFKKLFLYAKA